MKVSVIIPCFNNADHIEETLVSVQNQTTTEWECVVVDDGSTDDSIAIINSFSEADARFHYYSRPSHVPKGANSCRNFGVSKSSGTHLVFLDADDLLSKDCIEVREGFYRDEDLVIFSTAHFTDSIEEATPFISGLNINLTPISYRNMFLAYWIPWHLSSGLWKKDFFEKSGGFDPNLKRFQDVELHVRALSIADFSFGIHLAHGYTSYYRKSAFHTKIGLDKRRFILDQGFQYAKLLKSQLSPHDFVKSAGLFIYLLFRFEEVFSSSDLKEVKNLFISEEKGIEVSKLRGDLLILVKLFEKVLPKPTRLRKYLSYAIYRKFRFTQLSRLNT